MWRGKSALKTAPSLQLTDVRTRDFLTFLLLFAQYGGGAIYNYGTLTVKYGIFTDNFASYVSQQRKKPSLTSPFTRKMLEIPAPILN
jgi:hypothetical protein